MNELIVVLLYALSLLTGGLVLVVGFFAPGWMPEQASSKSALNLSTLRIPLSVLAVWPIIGYSGLALGKYFVKGTEQRRKQVFSWTESEERAESKWKPFDEAWETEQEEANKKPKDLKAQVEDYAGIIGFFHPFCNAGGGGERVLWAAIRATQKRYPKAICIVYTGDHDVTKTEILARVEDRFNIALHAPRVHFLYLSTRWAVLASTYPRFTLLGQSLGSLILLLDAFTLLVPDIFIDTMGYAFTLPLIKYCFPAMPVGSYVHYPTISTDMLSSLDDRVPATSNTSVHKAVIADRGRRGLNAGAGRGWKGALKKQYWLLFAKLYSWAGGHSDVVMTNSSWTQHHVRTLWGAQRVRQGRRSEIKVVFPPCAVDEMRDAIEVSEKSEAKREKVILYIAQFRPEKNHELILNAFAQTVNPTGGRKAGSAVDGARLVLIGSVRDGEDSKRVYNLKLLANELGIHKQTQFICTAPWPDILSWLGKSTIGVNGMWNEHFGIGVVEYQAAGLISVVNDSGGPKLDIVTEWEGGATGKLNPIWRFASNVY